MSHSERTEICDKIGNFIEKFTKKQNRIIEYSEVPIYSLMIKDSISKQSVVLEECRADCICLIVGDLYLIEKGYRNAYSL